MQSPIKQAVLKRCEEDIAHFSKASQSHHDYADYWGKTHLILGVSATIFSALSAVLTFAEYKIPIATLAGIGAILTGVLTYLNPSQREVDRRNAAIACQRYTNQVQEFLVRIDVYSKPEELLRNHSSLVELKTQLIEKIKYRL
jgi:hypothetical protein